MKILKRCLLGLIVVQLLVIVYLVSNVLLSIYKDKIDIVEKNEEVINVIENTKIETNILPDEEIDETLVKEDVIYKEEQKKEEVYNIVLVGMDARAYETKSRSDSIILMSYNNMSHTVKMVSFLRDTWVYLPERGYGRINSATAYGGTGLLINTLNENFDLDIQNYVQIKFDDFKKVIDILGGVDVELTRSEINYINNKLHTDDNDWKNDIKAEPGVVHLNGTQTLWHCRNRSIGDGDFSRSDRQREVLTLIMNKALTMTPTQLTTLIYEMKDYVNMNVPLATLLEIAEDAVISKDLIIESYHIPFDGMFNYANKNGASVIDIDMYDSAVKLHEILGLDTENIEVPKPDTKNYNKPKPKPQVEQPKVEEAPKVEEPPVVETPPIEEVPPIIENPDIEGVIEIPTPDINTDGLIDDVPPFEQGEEIENNTSEGVEGLPDNFEEEEVEGGLGNPKDDEIIGNSDLGLEIVE